MEIELVGRSQNIQRIRDQINRVAGTGLNTIITGETGVGKEVVVRQLYRKSDRCRKPFVKVNCAALPDTLLESEMFGYEKGAFTGANKRMRGKFEQTNGGTLFLDEIGDMSLPLQSKLLHVLQDGHFSPLGSEKTVSTDTWVIAATNHKLNEDLANGNFRKDLFFRLSTIAIYIEPLRRRPEDIPYLIDYYSQRYASLFSGKKLIKPSQKTIDQLCAYKWPGNVRELQNVLQQIMIMGDDIETIIDNRNVSDTTQPTAQRPHSFDEIPSAVDILGLEWKKKLDQSSLFLKEIKKKTANHVEKEAISYVLEQTGWNQTKAARILKISYKSLFQKTRELDIVPPPDHA